MQLLLIVISVSGQSILQRLEELGIDDPGEIVMQPRPSPGAFFCGSATTAIVDWRRCCQFTGADS